MFYRLLSFIVFGLFLTSCATNQGPSLEPKTSLPATTQSQAVVNNRPVHVAALFPLSGKDAKLGEAMQNAATLAISDLGDRQFELTFEDIGTGGAVAAANRAVQGGATLLLGPVFADDVRAVRPVAHAAAVPMIAFSTDVTAAGDGTFLIGILPGDQARQIAGFAAVRGLKNVLVVGVRDAYGQTTTEAFITAARAQGVNVTGPLWLAGRSDTLLSTRLSALIAAKGDGLPVDGVFLPLPPDQATHVMTVAEPHFAAAGRTLPVLMGTGLWDDINVMKYGALVGGYYAAPARGARARFEQIYLRQFGGAAPRLASLAYDAVALAITAGRQLGPDGVTPAALTRPGGFTGINGLFRFTSAGMAERALPILQVQPGSAVVAIPAPSTFANP